MCFPVKAENPFIRIEQVQCTTGFGKECSLHIDASQDKFDLTCIVVGARPQVSLQWIQSEEEIGIEDNATSSYGIIDGTWNTTVIMRHKTNEIGKGANFTCIATGEAVNGTANKTVLVVTNTNSNGKY